MTEPDLPTAEQIQTRVRSVLRAQFGPAVDNLADDADFVTSLDDRYDSLTVLDCISRIEAEFGIEVDFVAHDVRYWFASPGRIVDFVRDRVEDQAATGMSR